VDLTPEPLASAVGAGLDISSPYAQMIVDIGDGVTDVAVIRSRRLVLTRSLRKACGDLHAALQRFVAKQQNIVLDRREAERLVRQAGAAGAMNASEPLPARGIDRAARRVELEISRHEISEAIGPVIADIVGTVRQTVQGLSPDIAVEVLESGICLTGGGACLHGIDTLIASATSVDVKLASEPLRATINGASQMLAAATDAGLWQNSPR
jgi:rod shape-determining protein MreB